MYDRYASLIKVGTMLKACGRFIQGLAYLFGGLNCLLVIVFWMGRAGVVGPTEILAGLVGILVSLTISVGVWMIGLFNCAAGDACIALADIASNSQYFSQVALVEDA